MAMAMAMAMEMEMEMEMNCLGGAAAAPPSFRRSLTPRPSTFNIQQPPSISRRFITLAVIKRSPERLNYTSPRVTKENGLLYVEIDPFGSNSRKLDPLIELLISEAVGVIPTNTVYAMVCDLRSSAAIERLCGIQDIKPSKPLSILCHSFKDIDTYTNGLPRGNGDGLDNLFRVVEHCLPGPHTFILTASKELPKQCVGKGTTPSKYVSTKKVDICISDDSVCQAILEKMGSLLIFTSVKSPRENEWILDSVNIADVCGPEPEVLSDHNDVRCCCTGPNVCFECWPLMEVPLKLLKKTLSVTDETSAKRIKMQAGSFSVCSADSEYIRIQTDMLVFILTKMRFLDYIAFVKCMGFSKTCSLDLPFVVGHGREFPQLHDTIPIQLYNPYVRGVEYYNLVQTHPYFDTRDILDTRDGWILICRYGYPSSIFAYNPFTRDVIQLPNVRFDPPPFCATFDSSPLSPTCQVYVVGVENHFVSYFRCSLHNSPVYWNARFLKNGRRVPVSIEYLRGELFVLFDSGLVGKFTLNQPESWVNLALTFPYPDIYILRFYGGRGNSWITSVNGHIIGVFGVVGTNSILEWILLRPETLEPPIEEDRRWVHVDLRTLMGRACFIGEGSIFTAPLTNGRGQVINDFRIFAPISSDRIGEIIINCFSMIQNGGRRIISDEYAPFRARYSSAVCFAQLPDRTPDVSDNQEGQLSQNLQVTV